MDPELLQNYRYRWQAVAAIERDEQRKLTLSQRWEQLNYLYLLGGALINQPYLTVSQQEELVWRRWAQLKDSL